MTSHAQHTPRIARSAPRPRPLGPDTDVYGYPYADPYDEWGEPEPEPRPARGGHRRASAAGVLWRILEEASCWAMIVGLACVTLFAWTYWGRGLDTSSVSHDLETATTKRITSVDGDKVAPLTTQGEPPVEAAGSHAELFGYLYLPKLFGNTYKLPIQEGTDDQVLANMGVGHYEETATPGQRGNASYAGHATYSDLADIGRLTPGDRIIIEGAEHWWVYQVNQPAKTVHQSEVGVVAPDAAGAEYGLTLTTCTPVMPRPGMHATHRLIVHASLVGWADKSQGKPQEIADTHTTAVDRLTRRVQTVSEQVDLPVSGVLGLGLTAMWLLLNLVCWLVSHRRMTRVEWRRGPALNPMTILWRLTAGLWPGNTIVFQTTRIILTLILYAGLVFCMFRWACPWMADTFMPDTASPAL